MVYSVWIIEASGKISALKDVLTAVGRPKDRILSTFGRLMDLPDDMERIDSKILSPHNIPWKELRPGQINKLVQICRGASEVLIATDTDLEGELIAEHLASNLEGTGVEFYRVHLRGISVDHVRQALASKGHINGNAVAAAVSRRLFDRHIGYQMNVESDPFPMSMGRIVSPLIKSLADDPATTVRIDVKLLNGWKAVFNMPAFLSLQCETFCGVINALRPVEPQACVTEEFVHTTKPLTGQDAILLCADSTDLKVGQIVDALQENYMNGQISYPRTDSRRLGEVSIKWAKRIAELKGVSFSNEHLDQTTDAAEIHSFDAHEALMPLTERGVRTAGLGPALSPADRVLSVLTEHSAKLGCQPRRLTREIGEFGDDDDSKRFRHVARAYVKYMTLERWVNEDGILQANSPMTPSRQPDLQEGRVRLWRDSPALAAVRRMVQIGLGRPSTIAMHAEKVAKTYLNESGEVNNRGQLMLHRCEERCPALLKPGIAKQLELVLVNTTEDNTVSGRLKDAWVLLGQPLPYVHHEQPLRELDDLGVLED